MDFFGHLKTITYHRILVCKGCFRIGLYWQGLTHDLSKYEPVEFLNGIKYYQGYRSPNNAEREDKGYSAAWLHHKGRNRHHFEYWIDFAGDGFGGKAELKPIRMPDNYIAEMFIDRVSASKVYKGNEYNDGCPYAYYKYGDISHLLHPYTQTLLEAWLIMLAKKGEAYTFRYIKRFLRLPREKRDRIAVKMLHGGVTKEQLFSRIDYKK